MSAIPGIHTERVREFLRQALPELGTAPIDFELISGGKSNLTYRVRAGDRTWALRRPPLGHVLATAHDMVREHRVLAALAGTDVPAPRPVALCEDPAVNDAPFYVMEFCEGVVLHDRAPAGFLNGPEDGRRISQALVDTLAKLHAVDPGEVGLGDFGRPEGYLERQVKRWSKQWESNQTGPLPEIDALLARLADALPKESGHAIVHGDYRLGNMALAPDDPGRIVALFDWEMATLGDPLADLGYTLIYWVEAGEDEDGQSLGVGRVTAEPGFYTRDEIASAYAKTSGRDVSAVAFYQVLALTKLAVISEGIFKRFQMGKTVGEGFDDTVRATPFLARRALEIAEQSDDPRLRG
jgi:aminoglycoside phosphotransferase (APT) family kinase protein